MADNLNEELQKLHAEFKSALDRQDEAATARLNEAMDKIEAKAREIEKAANRPTVDASADLEQKAAFGRYLRSGDVAEIKAMSASVAAEGGYTVPKTIDSALSRKITDISEMRSVARVISVSTPDFHIPFSTRGTASSWVGEKTARSETDAPTITEITPAFGELYASPFVTQTLLEDSQFDIEGYIVSEVATEFARAEGAAFLNGSGTNQPKGLLTAPTDATADGARTFGTVQHILSGAAASIGTSADVFIDITQSLKAGYRANAKWLMNKDTLGKIRKLKDNTGQLLWQPSVQAGQPSTFLGYAVVEMEDMPSVAAGNLAVAFGDFSAAYVIADRVGVSMLRNPYSNAPYIAFQTRKRVGGTFVNTEAVKFLKIAAS